MYPFYLDLRNSACLFLKLMHMKERRQDQDLADIKVEKKNAEQPQFLQAVHTGKAIKRPTWAFITAAEVSFLARASLSMNCNKQNIAAEWEPRKERKHTGKTRIDCLNSNISVFRKKTPTSVVLLSSPALRH